MAKQHQQMGQQSRHQQTSISIDPLPSPEQQSRPETLQQPQEQQQQQQVAGVIKKSSLKKKKATAATASESIGTMSKQEGKMNVNAAEAQQDNVAGGGGGGGGKKEKRARRRRRQVHTRMRIEQYVGRIASPTTVKVNISSHFSHITS